MTNPPLPPDVEAALRRVARETRAHRMVLFGSRARGDHHADSDWDVAVILPDDTLPGQVTRETLRPLYRGTALEVHPIRQGLYLRARKQAGTLSRSIAEDGIELDVMAGAV